jgi:membrane protease YdiL (CAAX protease family)
MAEIALVAYCFSSKSPSLVSSQHPEKNQQIPCQLNAWKSLAILISYFFTQYLSFHAIMYLAGVVAGFSERTQDPGEIERFYQSARVWAVFGGFLLAGVVLFFMTRYFSRDFITDGSSAGIGWSLGGLSYFTSGLVLGGVLGCGILAVGWYIFPPESDPSRGVFGEMAYTSGGTRFIWACLLFLVIPPLEEFLYRGVLYAGISKSLNPVIAAFVVTALFVLGHLPHTIHYLPGIVAITLLGILTLALRVLTRSLGPAVALHSTYNLCIVIGTYFFFPVL